MALKPEDIAGGYLGAKYAEGLVEGAVATTSILAKMPLPLLLIVLGLNALYVLGIPGALIEAGESLLNSLLEEHQTELVRKGREATRAIGQVRE